MFSQEVIEVSESEKRIFDTHDQRDYYYKGYEERPEAWHKVQSLVEEPHHYESEHHHEERPYEDSGGVKSLAISH